MIEPWLKPAASGTSARIVAIAVMRIGRSAGVAALDQRVVGRVALGAQPLDEVEQDDRVRHDDPDEHQEPDERAEPDRPVRESSAGKAPIVASGRLNRMMNGVTSELNASTIIR